MFVRMSFNVIFPLCLAALLSIADGRLWYSAAKDLKDQERERERDRRYRANEVEKESKRNRERPNDI